MLWRGHCGGHDEVESGLGLAVQRHGQLLHSYSSSKTQFKSQLIETYFPSPPSHIGMTFSFTPSMLLSELLWLLVFSRSVMFDSLRPHGLQHGRLACHHQLPEFTQTPVHRVSDAIQPSLPLSSPSPAFNLSQHQGLFQ